MVATGIVPRAEMMVLHGMGNARLGTLMGHIVDRLRLFVLAGLAGVALSCNGHRNGNGLTMENGQAGHWVHDEQLRLVMGELAQRRLAIWPQEIEETRLERRREAFDQAEVLAGRLKMAAERIPVAVAHIDMTEVDRRSFLAQVETLFEQADDLTAAALREDLGSMRVVLARIDSTCDSCHRRFRDFSGPRYGEE